MRHLKDNSKTLTFTAATLVLVLAFVSVASGAIDTTFNVTAKPGVAKKPISLRVKERIGETAAPQPPALTRQVLRLQRGGKYYGRYFKHCRLARLRAKGPKGCSKRSLIGRGTGTGSAKPIIPNIKAKLWLFNGERKHGRDHVYIFVLPDIGPTFVVEGKVKKRKGRYGYELDFKVPPIKTLPGVPDASVTGVKTHTYRKRVTVRKHGKKRRRYIIVAPRRCKGKWRAESVFYFADGRVDKQKDSMRCKKRRRQ
jgi:hypothetical protein